MIVKRFSGRSAEEALALAKWELGDDAIILSSGKARDRWWKFWESGFQVLVAADYPRKTASANGAEEAASTRVPVESPVGSGGRDTAVDHKLDDVITLVQKLGQRLDRLAPVTDNPAQQEWEEWFLTRGVTPYWARELAQELLRLAGENGNPLDALGPLINDRLGPPAPIHLTDAARVLFLGPTGSGKTTTIAKLAAYFHLERQKSVLLISNDTFRVAAAEQLKTFAEIIGVPFQVALRPQDIPDLMTRHPADVVLIDTAGHSPQQAMYLAELRSLVDLAKPTDIQLVLPATMHPDLLTDVATRFAEGLPAKLCFTKLDEVRYPGAVLAAALSLGWPLSYFTDGQHVPDDIQVAFADRLAEWLQGGTVHG